MKWRAWRKGLSNRSHWSFDMGGAGRLLRSRRIATRLCGAFLLCFCALAAAHASEWKVSIVPDVPGGKFASLKMDSYGNAHVVHVDGFESIIRYSFWDRTLNKWFSTPLEKGSGFCSLVLDSKQRPHISYPAGTGVVHRFWDGEKWQRQFADVHARVINYYTSIVLDANDYPSISFYEEAGAGETELRLRIVSWNGTFWNLKTIDPTHGSGKFNSMAMNSHGFPEIAIGNVEYMNLSLRYARWNGETWNVEVLDKTVSSKWSVAMVLDKSDTPHIVYTDVGLHQIKYVTKRAGKWETQVVGSISRTAYPDRDGIALDDAGNPYVSYYDAGTGVLKVAHQVNGRWVAEIVDDEFAGFTSSMQIANDTIWLVYGDEGGERLRFAHRPIKPPAPAMSPEPAAIKR